MMANAPNRGMPGTHPRTVVVTSSTTTPPVVTSKSNQIIVLQRASGQKVKVVTPQAQPRLVAFKTTPGTIMAANPVGSGATGTPLMGRHGVTPLPAISAHAYAESPRYSPYSPSPIEHIKRQILPGSGKGGSTHRSSNKFSKGLRRFSTKVMNKIKEKGVTKYNEVADELVQDYFDDVAAERLPSEQQKLYDQKNIRRRVYDAINVLMALGIIVKDKKDLCWVGMPGPSSEECAKLKVERDDICGRIEEKMEILRALIIQQVAFQQVIRRNEATGLPEDTSTVLKLPFVVVSTDNTTKVECSISTDKSEYLFDFDQPFEIHDDAEVLRRLNLDLGISAAHIDPKNIPKIKACLPGSIHSYVQEMSNGTFPRKVVPRSAQLLPKKNTKLEPGELDPKTEPDQNSLSITDVTDSNHGICEPMDVEVIPHVTHEPDSLPARSMPDLNQLIPTPPLVVDTGEVPLPPTMAPMDTPAEVLRDANANANAEQSQSPIDDAAMETEGMPTGTPTPDPQAADQGQAPTPPVEAAPPPSGQRIVLRFVPLDIEGALSAGLTPPQQPGGTGTAPVQGIPTSDANT